MSKTNIRYEITGTNVRDFCHDNCLTLASAADMFTVDSRTISRWQTLSKLPKPAIRKIVRVLERDYGHLNTTAFSQTYNMPEPERSAEQKTETNIHVLKSSHKPVPPPVLVDEFDPELEAEIDAEAVPSDKF